jgi:hypothetical protein
MSGDPMTAGALVAKWSSEAEGLRRRQALVSGAEIINEFLADFGRVQAQKEEEVLTLLQAAEASGYSGAHLARLARAGKLKTLRPVGSGGPLTFRRSDLPQKPGFGHTETAGVHDLASRLYRGKEARNGRS